MQKKLLCLQIYTHFSVSLLQSSVLRDPAVIILCGFAAQHTFLNPNILVENGCAASLC